MDGQTCRHTRVSGYGLGERRMLPDESSVLTLDPRKFGFTAVLTNIAALRDVTPCGLVYRYQRVGGAQCLSLQGT
jgi:hypothetical protein